MQQDSNPKILKLAANQRGRDFVIGDVHGAFDLVLAGMEKVKFDVNRDRLLSVGDLIDRGPHSAQCLEFLRQDFTFAVRGNHEQQLLDIYQDGDPGPELMAVFARMFKMQWWLLTPEDTRQAILQELSKLPLAIEIQTLRGAVGLVHGDVPKAMSWPAFIQRLEEGCEITTESALWGRNRLETDDTSGVQGIGRLFVGHTVQFGGPKTFGNVFAVDTGAVFSLIANDEECGLTMANIVCRTETLSAAVIDKANKIVTVEARDGDDQPFGSSSLSRVPHQAVQAVAAHEPVADAISPASQQEPLADLLDSPIGPDIHGGRA